VSRSRPFLWGCFRPSGILCRILCRRTLFRHEPLQFTARKSVPRGTLAMVNIRDCEGLEEWTVAIRLVA
jgi:hypothetical protein